MSFSHLHVHTVYSLLDGVCRIDKLISAAKDMGQTSIAITDHGVMYGAIDFYKEAQKQGIKAIIGCEVYVAPDSRFKKTRSENEDYYHLVLLCKNQKGYENLIKMVSLGFTQGFYSKPRIDRELLENHSEGLVALSGCLAGEVSRKLSRGDYDGAKSTALWYKALFGEDYYLEIQDHGLTEQKSINAYLVTLSREIGVPLVATNDVHYVSEEDFRTQKVLLCVQTGKKLSEDNPIEFKVNEFYLKSEEQMLEIFASVPEAVQNTGVIADKCDLDFEFGKIKLPVYDIGEKEHFTFFKEKCYEGLYRIYGDSPSKELIDRLEYELNVINTMGYVDYYLIVQDYVNFAKNNGIPVGPGRGSGAASLAAYCIGITGIDPVRFNLIFERFLNPERVSMPDFDVDFCYVRRQEVIDYVKRKYGEDRVSQIVAFGTMAARAAVRDVGRVMDIPYATCDKVAKLIPSSVGMTIDEAVSTSAELRELINTDLVVAELIDMARRVEGTPRNTTTHAAGVVISDRAVSDYVPLAMNDDAVVTQFPMTTLDELGLLKMDFLGLRNLTVIADAEKEIRETEPDFDIDKISLNDEKTIKMMASGLTEGVFQFESTGMKSVLRSFQPENIEDLIAIISLYRPGPMDSIPKYIHNRHNPKDIRYLTPLLKPILDVTYGCIVYQEQVMQIFRDIGGYSLGRADIVRRAMSKKKHDVMQREEDAFIEGAVSRGVNESVAKKIFDEMSAFSSYAFNKAHAAAYAHVAFQTAYLKCHYTGVYMAALLTSVLDSQGKVSSYTAECQRLGIKVLPPHVNKSFKYFKSGQDGIRFGLLAIKNIGASLVEKIIEVREQDGEYKNIFDFCTRLYGRDLNRRALEGLIKCGALDGLADNRRQMLQSIDTVLTAVESESRAASSGQLDLFSFAEVSVDNTSDMMSRLARVEEMPKPELLKMEKEATGLYLSEHPMNAYSAFIQSGKFATTIDILDGKFKDNQYVNFVGMVASVTVRQSKNNQQFAVLNVEDIYDSISVTMFSKAFILYKHLLSDGAVLIFTGRVTEREDRPNEILCDKVAIIPESSLKISAKTTKRGVYLRVQSMERDVMEKIKEILRAHVGDYPVILYCEADSKRYKAPDGLMADGTDALFKEFGKILGENNVKIIE